MSLHKTRAYKAMLQLDISSLITWAHTLEPLWVGLSLFLSSTILIFLFNLLFGVVGLYTYVALAIIIANIQVLKSTLFLGEPTALGTIIFSSTFLCSDIINEYYGEKAAYRSIFLSFAAYFCFATFMFITLSFRPAPDSLTIQHSMEYLFLPVPVLFFASLSTYLISQSLDIYVFARLKNLSKNRFLWARTSFSTMLAMFVDTTIFSTQVWYLFAADPLPWPKIWHTYILNTYCLQLFVILLYTPIIYIVKKRKFR